MAKPPGEKPRCSWPKPSNALYVHYHDTEWGVPEYDSRALYEKLILDGAQAGLSWETILNKRESYRAAYQGFEPARIARWGERESARLLADAGIVRNRLKVAASITNAKAYLQLEKEEGSFSRWLWAFVDYKPVQNAHKPGSKLVASTPLSDRVSKELQRRGFKFVGTTIVYAYMQAVGMVNDHVTDCFRHEACAKLGRKGHPER
jgi:DNA-3-methyladenine glycosylase I